MAALERIAALFRAWLAAHALFQLPRLFEKGIAISQRQEARLFELRATTQLASVLARQGRAQAGEARLRAIIDAFDTKHPIVDLVAARKVLPTLHR